MCLGLFEQREESLRFFQDYSLDTDILFQSGLKRCGGF